MIAPFPTKNKVLTNILCLILFLLFLSLSLFLSISLIITLAGTGPDTKIDVVRLFQQRGHVVLMCGDGGNDIGALSRADVGVALLTGFGLSNAATAAAPDADIDTDTDTDTAKSALDKNENNEDDNNKHEHKDKHKDKHNNGKGKKGKKDKGLEEKVPKTDLPPSLPISKEQRQRDMEAKRNELLRSWGLVPPGELDEEEVPEPGAASAGRCRDMEGVIES